MNQIINTQLLNDFFINSDLHGFQVIDSGSWEWSSETPDRVSLALFVEPEDFANGCEHIELCVHLNPDGTIKDYFTYQI